jgi:hypothetical protein
MGQKIPNGGQKKATIFGEFWITPDNISQSKCREFNVREYLKSLYYKQINKKEA